MDLLIRRIAALTPYSLVFISLQDKGLGAVIISQSCPEKNVANPGLQVVKSLICGRAPVPIHYLFPGKGSFGCKARENGLQVVY